VYHSFGRASSDREARPRDRPDRIFLHRYPRIRLLSVILFPSGHVLSWRGPRDRVDHTIWAVSRGVTSGDRAVRGRTAGFRDTVQRAAHTAGMPVRLHHIVVDAHDLPGWPGSGPRRPAGRSCRSGRTRSSSGPAKTHPPACASCRSPTPRRSRTACTLTSPAAPRTAIRRSTAFSRSGRARVGIGQTGAESWTALAGPEGNEFCVVRPKETLIR
jgi:hypothetical protein